MKGYKHTPETVAKRKGKRGPSGRKLSQEQKEKLRQLGKIRGFPRASMLKAAEKSRGQKRAPHIVERIRLGIINSKAWRDSMTARRGKKRPKEIGIKIQKTLQTSRKWRDACWKKILCVTTGQSFSSFANAERFFGLPPRSLSKAIIRGTKCGGMEWEKI